MARLRDAVASAFVAPQSWQSTVSPEVLGVRGMPVSRSDDLDRILALPRRDPLDISDPSSVACVAMVESQMEKYSRGPRACVCAEIDRQVAAGKRQCITQLLPIQAWALHETTIARGLLGSIAVGSGKCHDASTEYFDYASGRRRSVSEPGAVKVATFDQTLKIAEASAFPSGRKLCVRVQLVDGSAAIPSTDHPYLTHRGWIRAGELRPGEDFVAVATAMPEPAVTTQASDEEVALVAYMLSDGGCSQATMRFTNATAPVIADWQRCVESVGCRWVEKPSRSAAREFTLCGAGEEQSANGVRGNGFRTRWNLRGLAKDKRAHAALWGLPRRQVSLFLNRFWACDGHVSKTALECTLASEKMIDDLRFLCARLGIRTRKHQKRASYVKDGCRHTFKAWRVSMSGSSALRFLDEVGDVLGKEIACRDLRVRLETTKRNTNYDVVPIGPEELHEICDELGHGRRGSRECSGLRSKIFRDLHVTRGQHISRAKFVEFCHTHAYRGKYAHFATTDVAWERVESIVDVGVRDVFDLTVPGTHNFVANGIVVHNTVLDILTPLAMVGCRQAVLLIPPSLVDQIVVDYQLIAEHFRVPGLVVGNRSWAAAPGEPVLRVLPYSRLSQPEASDWLENLKPDLIIADECDALKDRTSARTMRVMRYFSGPESFTKEQREERLRATRFCGWTGSMSDQGLGDYCLDPSSRVLTRDLRWIRSDEVKTGDELVGFNENLKRTKMCPTRVTATKLLTRPRVKIVTTRGTLVCSTDHKWVLKGRARTFWKKGYTQLGLTNKPGAWIDARDVRPGDTLAYFVEPWQFDDTHEGGYLAGLLDGEGWIHNHRHSHTGQVAFAQKPGPVLERFKQGLRDRHIDFSARQQHNNPCFRVLPKGENVHIRVLGMFRPTRLLAKADLLWVGRCPAGKNTRHARVLSVEQLPDGPVVAMQTSTGTLVAEGFLSHNCHLALLALREGSPLPMDPMTVEEWDRCLGANPNPSPPGELLKLCRPGESARDGFGRRVRETMGFVVTTGRNVVVTAGGREVDLRVVEKPAPPLPPIVREALAKVRKGVRPDTMAGSLDDEELEDPLAQAKCAREVASGFFYRWIFPRGEPVSLIKEWLAARKLYNSEQREIIIKGQQYLDSPKLCETAARRAYDEAEKRADRPEWKSEAWPRWRDVKDKVEPKTQAVRLHPFLAEDAAEWALANRGIVWYGMVEFAQWVAEHSGLTIHGGGPDAGARLRAEVGDRSIIASIKSHGRGRDGLQLLYERNLVAQVPSSANALEQLLGRLVRRGQRGDVLTEYYGHTAELQEAMGQAVRRAEYARDTLGVEHRILGSLEG